ncbi:ESPR-type extended signal peptide-containing protein [Proteus myxofaciens]|uniref:ESPR domain-containing protein n=1 Tax=Proteus myxofaciens ATCC 19692 TaxID=1354337 RepID=A0A198GN28_9GAMM|nr:ESPR-type extended signal peptide-containing protein [Proteus myxofaciens]OAT38269.1 hypothetical protein M983_0232 [Proteus myxofaciens ATCC 19692]
MNKIYRVIWDRIKHVFIAVSELSNGNKKATYGSNNKKEALKKKRI